MRNQLRRQAPVADAAHLVAVPAIVADHLCALVRDMLSDGSQKVGGGEDLEVAVDLGIEPGAVDDPVGRGLQRHFLHGEGIPQDVLGQVFQVGLGLWGLPLSSDDLTNRPSATRAWMWGWKSRYSPNVCSVRMIPGMPSGQSRAVRR